MTLPIYCVAHPHWEAFAHSGVQATDHGLAGRGTKTAFTPHNIWKGCSVTLSHKSTMSILTQAEE